MDQANTMSFEMSRKETVRESLDLVYSALQEKGYNPVMQLVGYILTEDPTYITAYNGARKVIKKLDRNDILQELVINYLSKDN